LDAAQYVNPYIAGSPVTGTEMFFGREDVFSFVRRHLTGMHRDTPIVLYGQRRTGKTSVLYQLQRQLGTNYRCIFIDLHGLRLDGLENFLWGMASAIRRGLQRDHRLRTEIPDKAIFSADPRSAFETDFLDRVWSVLGDDHLVLMIDEVVRLDEEVRAGRLERDVFDYLRHLMQHFERLNFIFSLGSGLEEMKRDYAYLFSVALYHGISFLEPEAAHTLITQPAQSHYQVTPQAVKKILQITSGHPYYTQLVCHCMFDRWMRVPKSAMTVADVRDILPEAIELGSANLTFVWEDSTPEEQAMMAGLAAAIPPRRRGATVDQVQDAWAAVGLEFPEGEAAIALRSLAHREVVSGDSAVWFSVDLQRLWLDKHRRLDWVKEELAEAANEWSRAAKARTDSMVVAQPPEPGRESGNTSYTAAEVAQLYHFPPDLDGTGQRIGLVELGGGYRMADIRAYMKQLGLRVPNVVSVSVDGAANSPGDINGADAQVTLDIEVAAAAAPGADIVVYFAPNTDRGFADAIATAAADNTHNPSALCIGWGNQERNWTPEAITELNDALEAAAAKDITVCCAAGNQGATDGKQDGRYHVSFPASSPYVLACGGTRISVNAGRIEAEILWNDGPSGGVTGGGFSELFPFPAWQKVISTSSYGGPEGPRGRGIPDISANASPSSGYRVLLDSQWTVIGGTNAVAPLWCGLIARLNQGLGQRIGLLNPVLYRSLGPAGVLRDIAEGSTSVPDLNQPGYTARTGWDPCTGWGTPNGQQLLSALKVLQTTRQAEDGA
jgi:Subtilase family